MRSTLRLLAVLSLLALLAPLPALAGERSLPAPGAPAATRLADAGILRALEAVSAQRIHADIHFIASDQLAGRDTPSEGLQVAARYIRARLMALGFEPGAREGSYFHLYPLRTTALDEGRTYIEASGGRAPLRLDVGVDYHLDIRGLREDSTTRGRVVFLGEERASELEEGALEGAWALVFDRGGPTGPLRIQAQNAGALGLILTPGPSYDETPYAARFASRLAAQRRGSVSRVAPGGERRPGRSAMPRIYLPGESLARLLEVAPARPEAVPSAEWTPEPGTDLGLELADVRAVLGEGIIEVENVCGWWPGSDPELAGEAIVISAHYDHIGTSGDDIFNGADDNGSGTTGLMAIADALAAHGPLRRSVLLIWVSGEEKGLLGSAAWADDPWLPGGARPVANINIDMIGRNAPDVLYITPTENHSQHNGIVRLAARLSPLEGFPELGGADEFYNRSDQASFARLGIPVAFLFSGIHEDYHRASDTPEKIDTDKIRRVARLVVRMLDAMQTDTLVF